MAEAQAAGFDHVNLDLIYGTPGESEADFAASLAAVIDSGVDHVSAYALLVEEGTRLAARIRRGELPEPDDDVAADRYLAADAALSAAGFELVRGVQLGPLAGCAGAGTTCSTGVAETGGGWDRVRIATSAGCAGGTSSIRQRTPGGWRLGVHRRPGTRSSPPTSVIWRRSC